MKFFKSNKKRSHRTRRLYSVLPKVRIWSNPIPKIDALLQIKTECEQLWKIYGGNRAKAKSFWIDVKSKPRCALEKFALQCALFHHPDCAGAEFWVQIREGSTSDANGGNLDFHFDKDEIALKVHDVWENPTISTVTYVGDMDALWGAPLIVYDTTPNEIPRLKFPSHYYFPKRSWICFPIPNTHVSFSGNLLHGICGEILPYLYDNTKINVQQSEQQIYRRVSLPVNVWYKKPTSLEILPSEYISLLPEFCRDVENTLYFNINASSPAAAASVFKHVHLNIPLAQEKQQHEQENDDSDNGSNSDTNKDGAYDGKAKVCDCDSVPISSSTDRPTSTSSTSSSSPSLSSPVSECYYIQEHVCGDTGPLPLQAICDEWSQALSHYKNHMPHISHSSNFEGKNKNCQNNAQRYGGLYITYKSVS